MAGNSKDDEESEGDSDGNADNDIDTAIDSSQTDTADAKPADNVEVENDSTVDDRLNAVKCIQQTGDVTYSDE